MINGISGDNTNALQVLNAVRAFRMQLDSSKNVEYSKISGIKENPKDFTEVSKKANDKTTEETDLQAGKTLTLTYKEQYVSEFKQYISKFPGIQINDDDITYAMKFGRSIIVDRNA